MKLDINRAWTDAINLIQTNLSVVAVVAGVFFFLPYLAFVLFMPDVSAMGIESNPQDPTAAFNQVMALYADIWWMVALLTVAQTIGTLALLALLRAGNRPTVGQAIAIGAIGFLTSIAATIIFYIGFSVVAGLILGAAMAVGVTALTVILAIAIFVAFVYIAIKLSLLAPVIAIEKVYNPFAAMMRSWRLTKGNSLRIFAFLALLIIAVVVVSMVLGLIVGLVFGLAGGEVARIGGGLFNSLLNAVYVVLMLGVLAAIHRQLAGPDAEVVSETFE
ncbi:MAG: hypothetical protein CL807_02670 [Citromicrobium sp.]|nr:hypothetical protein [Citromicrobium sp.]MAS85371.1 hypothetical protein [Erythrobacteraceae bacterium]MBD75800.1 hypothetical protein [Citromicrobium sp.]MBT48380.1 hypothetical protein [Citromicrobium sp.]|tara:strand:- start:3102 stop:3926 length:825 start_codon:yes stop_codon:yes gene_type:complete